MQHEWGIVQGSHKFPIQCILTDRGGKFDNHDMEARYASQWIHHVKVGPGSSQMNSVELQRRILWDMPKCTMRTARFSLSLGTHELTYAARIKNRI